MVGGLFRVKYLHSQQGVNDIRREHGEDDGLKSQRRRYERGSILITNVPDCLDSVNVKWSQGRSPSEG